MASDYGKRLYNRSKKSLPNSTVVYKGDGAPSKRFHTLLLRKMGFPVDLVHYWSCAASVFPVVHGSTRFCSDLGAQFDFYPSVDFGVQVCHRRFFFRKHIAREGLALYCTMVRTIGANRDVLLKIVTKLPAGEVPNDVKVKTLLRQSLRSS